MDKPLNSGKLLKIKKPVDFLLYWLKNITFHLKLFVPQKIHYFRHAHVSLIDRYNFIIALNVIYHNTIYFVPYKYSKHIISLRLE